MGHMRQPCAHIPYAVPNSKFESQITEIPKESTNQTEGEVATKRHGDVGECGANRLTWSRPAFDDDEASRTSCDELDSPIAVLSGNSEADEEERRDDLQSHALSQLHELQTQPGHRQARFILQSWASNPSQGV